MLKEPISTIIKTLGILRFFLLSLTTLFFSVMAGLFFWTRYLGWNIDYYLMYSWGRTSTFIYGIRRVRLVRPKKTVGIYVAPHSSFWDIIILGSELRGFFVSKAEVVKWPVIGLGAKFVRTVFIDREKGVSALRAISRSAEKIFSTGNSLIMFPEGTRSFEHMRHFKGGAFHISYMTGKPVIPVMLQYEPRESVVPRVKGNFVIELFKQSMSSWRVKAKIKVLPQIDPSQFKNADELKDHVFKVMDEEYRKLS